MKVDHPNVKGAEKRSVVLWIVIAIVIAGFVIWGVVANFPRQVQRTEEKSALSKSAIDTALDLIKAKRYAEAETFFNELDDRLLGGNPKERSMRIEDFYRGLMEPPADSQDQNGKVIQTAEQKMVLRKQVAESIRFYTELCKDSDTLFPAGGHLYGFDDNFIDAVGDFERFKLQNDILKALRSPTDRQFDQLNDPFLRKNIVQWAYQAHGIGSGWKQLKQDPRDAGRLVARVILAREVFSNPESPQMDVSALDNTTKLIIQQHGLVVASRFLAGIMDFDYTLPDRVGLNSDLAGAFRAGWVARWEKEFLPSIGSYDEADWGNILKGFIAEVVQAQKADEQTWARLGLAGALADIRFNLKRAGFDPYEHQPFTDSLRQVAGDIPGYELPVNRALIEAHGDPMSVDDMVRVAEDLARNHMALELMNFYRLVDFRLFGPNSSARGVSRKSSSDNGPGVEQAFDFYTKLLLNPEAIIPTASHLADARERMLSANLKFDFEAIEKKQREVLTTPTAFQYLQFKNYPEYYTYNLWHWQRLMVDDTGSQWTQLKASPREVGATLAHIRKQRDLRSGAVKQRVNHWVPAGLCSAVIKNYDIVVAAKVLAGCCDVDPSVVARLGLSDHNLFGEAWKRRWRQIIVAKGGVPLKINWKDLYSEYLSGVIDELEPDEQWFAASGLIYSLPGRPSRSFRNKKEAEDYGEYRAAILDITKGAPAFRLVVEKTFEGIGPSWHAPMPNTDLGPFALSETLRQFITSDSTPLFARMEFCRDFARTFHSEIKYSAETIAAINHCYARSMLQCLEENGATTTDFPSGDEWNPTRALVGRAILRKAEEISDERTKRITILDSIKLLIRAGEAQQASDWAVKYKELLSDSMVMFSMLLKVGEIDAALEFLPPVTNAESSVGYTEAVLQHLPILLQKIEDPTHRYTVAVAVNAGSSSSSAKVPSRLQRLLPLAEKFDEITFPDEVSKLRCLSLLCVEPLAVTSGGAARELRKWRNGASFKSPDIINHGRDALLNQAFLGLLLKESKFKELEEWFEVNAATISIPVLDDVVEVFYEHTLQNAADRDFAAIAACIPLSRRLYLLRVAHSHITSGDANAVKVWLDLCHAAGDKMKTIKPWIDGIGGHTAEIYRHQEQFNTPYWPINSLCGLSQYVSDGLRDRWEHPENATARQGVIMAFLNDSSIRKAYTGPPVHPLITLDVKESKVPKIQNSLIAIKEWQRLNPEKAKEVAEILRASEKFSVE